ncbi:hypothetical protein GOODEAATRI_002424, partial [Goodea atripinnis]
PLYPVWFPPHAQAGLDLVLAEKPSIASHILSWTVLDCLVLVLSLQGHYLIHQPHPAMSESNVWESVTWHCHDLNDILHNRRHFGHLIGLEGCRMGSSHPLMSSSLLLGSCCGS